ncbi:unnamed protein product [Chondrus crispus]|uniref:Uncharacterized protein n=1 Tax=Chondrus crispus TaxID=2769 RepID=R7QDK8_CHOCR|nr:unnamed protein product [Chondrus crispus]CDF35495.1 unnamed protein product [Chondrus crispus]|eukprot:XP_005715314.1 unnamed protein product [Chondrus crispus]
MYGIQFAHCARGYISPMCVQAHIWRVKCAVSSYNWRVSCKQDAQTHLRVCWSRTRT